MKPNHRPRVRSLTEIRDSYVVHRSAVIAGEITWGPWSYNPKRLSLELGDDQAPHQYDVPLQECKTSAGTLDWIYQVSSKTWADDATIAGLIRAINDLLRPQATLCGEGREHGPIDVRARLTREKEQA